MSRDNHRVCIYVDDETIEIIEFIMDTYEVTQSAAFRICAKVVKGVILDAKEEKDRRGGAGSRIV